MCAARWSGSGGGLSRNGWLPTSGGGSTFLLYLRLLLHLPSYTYSCLPTCLLLPLPTIYMIYLPLLPRHLFPPMCTSAGHVGFHFEIDSCDTYTYIRCTCRKMILLSSGMISFLKLFLNNPGGAWWCFGAGGGQPLLAASGSGAERGAQTGFGRIRRSALCPPCAACKSSLPPRTVHGVR